jgi:hypothetical protein
MTLSRRARVSKTLALLEQGRGQDGDKVLIRF